MASTSKSAVSDYEHLKYRFGDENQVQSNDSEDEDFLPLKSRIKRISDEPAAFSLKNFNQNNNFSYSDTDRLMKLSENSMDSIQRVPVPSVWSPGMIIKPVPSLFITPEKRSKKGPADLISERDNILEPRDLNKVPAPMAWSPHQDLKPTVLITPEKHADFTSSLKDSCTTHKSAIQTEMAKSREKLSVRFDLPSSSSGDEFMDSSALSDSFITIKGKDEKGDLHKLSCASKVYNPMIYSDESLLDDSIPENSNAIDESDNVSLSTSANLVEKLNQLLISSNGLKDPKIQANLRGSVQLSHTNNASNNTGGSGSFQGSTVPEKSCSKKVFNGRSMESKKLSTSAAGTKSFQKHSHPTKETRSGPHHLSSSISPYHPPNSGTCVVREAKHPLVSMEYSYPFKNVEDTSEHEHIFSRPEFNSTLKVRSELDNLCDQDVDVQKAVEVKLSKSSTKQTEIQEKAAVFTNHLSDQFTDLVDLEPSVDRLCDRVVQMRTCKSVTQKKSDKHHKKNSNQKEPDLMEFYSRDLQKESPDLSLPGISPLTPGLISAPHDQAFDCYRHNRVWSGLQDF